MVIGIAWVIPPHRKETSRIKLLLKTEKTGFALIPPMANITLFYFSFAEPRLHVLWLFNAYFKRELAFAGRG